MPLIDVTDVLSDLDIACQSFSVVRRTETVNTHGEALQSEQILGPFVGAVQPVGDQSLVREEAYTTSKSAISVWTTFRLYDASRSVGGVTYQPDLVLWDGEYYLVRALNPWSDFGAGFVQADCIGFAYVPKPTS